MSHYKYEKWLDEVRLEFTVYNHLIHNLTFEELTELGTIRSVVEPRDRDCIRH